MKKDYVRNAHENMLSGNLKKGNPSFITKLYCEYNNP